MKVIFISPQVRKLLRDEKERNTLREMMVSKLDRTNYYYGEQKDLVDKYGIGLIIEARAVLAFRQVRKSAYKVAKAALTGEPNRAIRIGNEKKLEKITGNIGKFSSRFTIELGQQSGVDGDKIVLKPDWFKLVFEQGLHLVEVTPRPADEDKLLILDIGKRLASSVELYEAKAAQIIKHRWKRNLNQLDGFLARYQGHLAFGETRSLALRRLRASFKNDHELVYRTAQAVITW